MRANKTANGITSPRTDSPIVNLPPQWIDCDASPDPVRCKRLHAVKATIEATPPPFSDASQPPEATQGDANRIKTPGLIQRGVNFTKAATNHVLAGRPKATQEQIDERLAICQACPLYNAAKELCTKCGCSCGGKKTFLNKLAWADSVCPHPDGPRWIAVLSE